jgi:hypothetical protein
MMMLAHADFYHSLNWPQSASFAHPTLLNDLIWGLVDPPFHHQFFSDGLHPWEGDVEDPYMFQYRSKGPRP